MIPLSRSLLSLLTLAAASAIASAADAPGSEKARAALTTLVPVARTTDLAVSNVPGYFDAIVDGKVVYVSVDGQYLLQGDVFRFSDKTDLTADRMSRHRKAAIAAIPDANVITFAPPHPKYTVTVFTDVDCPYCQKLHQQIADYEKAGIAVRYVLFPLNIHPESHRKAMSLWCTRDQQAAYTAAMSGLDPGSKQCPNPLQANLAAGEAIGIGGTPGIFDSEGRQLGGYVAPADLLARLQAHDAAAPNGAKTAVKGAP